MHDLRSQFPVLERLAYLNAGTNGPVPRRAIEAAEASLRRQARGGPQRQGLLRGDDRARRRAARPRRRPARGRAGRGGAHRIHDRRRQRRAERARPRAGRRAAHLRRGAPGRAGAARRRSRPRHARAPGALRRACGRRRAPTRASSSARTCPGSPARSSTPPALAASGALVLLDGAQGLGAVPVDVQGARLRLLRRLGPEVAVRAERDRLPLRARRPGRAACALPGRAGRCSRTRTTRSTRRCIPTLAGSAPAFRLTIRSSGPTPRSTSSRSPASSASRRARSSWRPASSSGSRSAASRSRLAGARRSSRSSSTTRPRRSSACRRRASCCAICPGTSYLRASVGGWTTDEELDRLTETVTA